MDITVERTRTTWDIVIGILLLLGGLWLLFNVVFATGFLVLATAWTVLISGILMLVLTLVGIRARGIVWSSLIGGAALTVLGIFMLRHLTVSAFVLTMLAGALFLVIGLVRIGLATTVTRHAWVFVLSGVISVLLGLWVILNPVTATMTLLGILMAIQILDEGLTLLAVGRIRVRTTTDSAENTPAV